MAGQAQTVTYKVRSGDSLSAIAGKVYHKQNAWPVLYWANRDKIRWANVLGEGQVLKVPAMPAKIPAAPSQLGPAPAPAPAAAAAPVAASGGRARRRPRLGVGQLLGRRVQFVRVLRDRPRVRRQRAGHELERALRPVPVQRVDLVAHTAVRPATSGTPACPSSTRCSPTRWRRAASPTGPPTTAADRANPCRLRAPRRQPPRGPAREFRRSRWLASCLFTSSSRTVASSVQALQVSPGQLVQDAVAIAGQLDPDHAAVVAVRHPLHQPGRFGPVDELDRAVRPQQQVTGQVAHGGGPFFVVSLDRHQQLVLDVGQALGLGLVLAPAMETAQGDPELEQPLEVLSG